MTRTHVIAIVLAALVVLAPVLGHIRDAAQSGLPEQESSHVMVTVPGEDGTTSHQGPYSADLQP